MLLTESSPGGETVSRVIMQISSDSSLSQASLARTAGTGAALLSRLIERRGTQPNGILLGRVQSGKTTAMLLLAAAARDQGEKVVVLLLGTTNLLYKQNRDRLDKAFGLAKGQSDWAVIEPSALPTAHRFAKTTVESGRTLLIPILKHHTWLEKAATLVQQSGFGANLTVIDDESDLASLGDGSALDLAPPTNAALRHLLGDVSHGVYVHVTATPFAPMLLGANDRLAPADFALLEPGEGYIGSQQFFIDGTAAMHRTVGIDEIAQVSLGRSTPSLASALGIFIAASIKAKMDNPELQATSMLIHPSQSIVVHRRVSHAIDQLRNEWMRVLADGSIPKDLENGCAIAGLRIPKPSRLRMQLSLVKSHIVNADGTDLIDWETSPAHILIGGNKLSRGFTVEGLTVTYVARKPSTQADTMLQRARFYGYRIGLGGLMHLFASRASFDTWKQAALLEKQLWDRLIEIRDSSGSMTDLRRLVSLGASVVATANVASSGQRRRPSPWYPPKRPELETWRALGRNLINALEAQDLMGLERILASWTVFEPTGNQAVTTPAFGLPMVQRFIERFKGGGLHWALAERARSVRSDKDGFLIGMLNDSGWKAFERTYTCGLYVARILAEDGEEFYLPVLHIAGGVFSSN
jgi:hypothetical protein